MTVKSLRVNFLADGADKVKTDIDSISVKADKLDKKRVRPEVSVDDKAGPKLAELQRKLEVLNRKRAEAKVGVNDSAAKAKLLTLSRSLESLNKVTANPNLSVRGADSALIKLYRLDAALDKLDHKTARTKVDVVSEVSKRGWFKSLFGTGVKEVSEGAVQDGETIGSSLSQGGLRELASNKWVLGGVLAAVVASAPFVAQAFSGMLVFGLGAGLAAMAVYGASKSKKVAAVFDHLKKDASADLVKIGASFVPVVSGILSAADHMLGMLTPVFSDAAKVMSGPFKQFGLALVKSFGSPAVRTSIESVAAAFGKLLKAVSPSLSADIGMVATGITRIAQAAGKNPGAFAGFVNVLFKVASGTLGMIASLSRAATYMETRWLPFWHAAGASLKLVFGVMGGQAKMFADILIGVFKVLGDVLTGNWGKAWSDMRATGVQVWGALRGEWRSLCVFFDSFLHGALDKLGADWTGTWNHVSDFTKNIWGHIENVTTGSVKDVTNWVSTGWNSVYSNTARTWGRVSNFFTSIWGHIENVTTGAVKSVVNWVSTGWGTVYDDTVRVFGSLAHAVGHAFSAVKGAVAAPIDWVVDHVASGFDTITSHLGMGAPLGSFEHWRLAAGGVLPGYSPGRDTVPAMLSPGEAVLNPGATRALGSSAINRLNSAYRAPGAASGVTRGVLHAAAGWNPVSAVVHGVEDVGHLAKSAFGKAVDVGKIAAALVSGNGTALTNALTGLLGGVPGSGLAVRLAEGLGKSIISDAVKFLSGQLASSGSGPAGVGVSGGEMANGRQLFDYLLGNVFAGHKMAAAGAIASIWGESTWNPFAQGTGGRGLIGWTPPGSISDAAFKGGMATQLPAIVKFIGTSGDWGTVHEMEGATSILQAANLWGKGVERYGINDVHAEGLALAARIMGASTQAVKRQTQAEDIRGGSFSGYSYANGGWINEPVAGRGLFTGANYSFGERGREYVSPNGDAGTTVVVNFNDVVTDPDGVALKIQQMLRVYKRHHGNQKLGLD